MPGSVNNKPRVIALIYLIKYKMVLTDISLYFLNMRGIGLRTDQTNEKIYIRIQESER